MYPQVKHSDDVCSKKPDAYVTELSLEMDNVIFTDSKMLLELLSEYGFSNYLMNVLTLLSNVIEKRHLNDASDHYISLWYRQIHTVRMNLHAIDAYIHTEKTIKTPGSAGLSQNNIYSGIYWNIAMHMD
jgi:hypothetical protein